MTELRVTELRVECMADRAEMPDLGLSLRRGQVVWVPADSGAKSACLRALRDIRAVSVVSAQRCSAMRSPPPPSFRLARKGTTPRAQTSGPVPVVVQGGVPVEELDARIEQAVAGAVDKLADRLVAALGQQRAAPASSAPLNEEALSRAVADAVSQALSQQVGSALRSGGGGSRALVSGPEEPVYIPSGIVSSETATDLQVTAQATDAGDLAGAASALRKTRTRKTTGTPE